jgi:DNA-binding NtrC family response regulator
MTEAELAEFIIGESPAIRRVRELILRIAPTSLPVLIQGPTGSGKELVAEALHRASGRSGAFVPFNVCAISDAMFEDALFGHVRGAFTGATHDRRGYLAEADRGTAFLDEISSLSLVMQPKLLRAIETRKFRPVGSSSDRTSEFRLLAAANEDLHVAARGGRFRADLAHRMAGMIIHMPSLAARREDIPLLVAHFAARAQRSEARRVEFKESAVRALTAQAWSGNVRELKFLVETVVAVADSSPVSALQLKELTVQNHDDCVGMPSTEERLRIERVLREANWDTDGAANALGVHRSTLYRWMKRVGIGSRERQAAAKKSEAYAPLFTQIV